MLLYKQSKNSERQASFILESTQVREIKALHSAYIWG